ncbi:MAG: [acyl-carrier-protein] S-malonyltransferase [Planctomycetes bacterium RBG_16_43_13]|nr:MAG: [acyl-carrier-protein] S-malonyltransferase [Planctomycetes bacterium RBG_16_43_13]
MKRCAFLFPGQGAQYVGMGKDFYDKLQSVRDLYKRASEILGFDIAQLCFEGPQETLNKTDICQPALLVTSIATLEFYKTNVDISTLNCSFAAGLSLGEHTALAFAGAIKFEDAVGLVKKRGQFMQEACDAVKSSMVSILGLDREKVKVACDSVSSIGIVTIANINCPGQIVISGDDKALAAASEKCKELGARRAIPLQVAGAYHSPLMKSAQDKLKLELAKVKITKPTMPVIANVSAKPVTEPEEIKTALSTQVVNSVLWEDSMRYMIGQGITAFYEFGPGRVLTGLAKKITPDLELHCIEKITDLQ